WGLWGDAANAGRYAVQETDDWNVFTICLIAGFDPFVEHDEEQVAAFEAAAKNLFKGANLVGDIATCNQALVSGEIDFYLPGGTYSASLARADGQRQIRGVTPNTGPVAGKGGVSDRTSGV